MNAALSFLPLILSIIIVLLAAANMLAQRIHERRIQRFNDHAINLRLLNVDGHPRGAYEPYADAKERVEWLERQAYSKWLEDSGVRSVADSDPDAEPTIRQRPIPTEVMAEAWERKLGKGA